MPDSGAVDTAILQKLVSDATLAALLPHGVYFGTAPAGKTQFAVVSIVTAFDSGQFAEQPQLRRAVEDITYAVKAVVLGSATNPAAQACARIDALLEDQPLTIPGYGWMSTERIERIRDTEVDENDSTIRWQHRGGRYRVQVTPLGVTS